MTTANPKAPVRISGLGITFKQFLLANVSIGALSRGMRYAR